MNTKLKAEWVRKLVKTKNFIVITDNDAIMNIRGVRPDALNLFDLAIQRAHLSAFRDRLSGLIKQHDALLGVKPKPSKKAGKKINVKKG